MFSRLTNSLKLLLLFVIANSAFAQSLSHDGNRWYEIEVSIFTNRALSVQDQELSLPALIELSYPDDILLLKPATTSYSYPFPDELTPASERMNVTEAEGVELPIFTAEFSPSGNAFQLADFGSDAFIALAAEHQQFRNINADIHSSSEHRLLYHAVWRQPVLDKVQASAIFIRGGDRFAEHNELEGSITLSYNYNINRVDIDTQLWLNSFMINMNNELSQWSVPAQALNDTLNIEADINQDYFIENAVLMNETRPMRSNEFHYLDHPAFGLLIQIRPYLLPDKFDFEIP